LGLHRRVHSEIEDRREGKKAKRREEEKKRRREEKEKISEFGRS